MAKRVLAMAGAVGVNAARPTLYGRDTSWCRFQRIGGRGEVGVCGFAPF